MYKGYIEVTPTEDEWDGLYSNPSNNLYGCLENQYLIVYNAGSVADRFKWVNGEYKKLSYRQVNNSFVSKIKPRNIQQQCALHLNSYPEP